MRLRRPLAALFTALTLVGGGATLTACNAAGQDQKDGTTDGSNNDGGDVQDEVDQGNDSDGREGDSNPVD